MVEFPEWKVGKAVNGRWSSLPGPASEESPPPPSKVPGICACGNPVHTAAPARDGNYYCESCVKSMTCLHETLKFIERKKAEPPTPPRSVGQRPYFLMGDLCGPKV